MRCSPRTLGYLQLISSRTGSLHPTTNRTGTMVFHGSFTPILSARSPHHGIYGQNRTFVGSRSKTSGFRALESARLAGNSVNAAGKYEVCLHCSARGYAIGKGMK
jgi:hypothetical protein